MNYGDGFVLPLPGNRPLFKGIRSLLPWLLVGMALLFVPWSVNAVEVYQWTDENGVVHFSQWAPTEPEKDVSTLQVDGSPPPGYDPAADLYNVQANQKYMESLWSDREKRQEESRDRQAAQGPQMIQQMVTPEYDTWPVYPGYGLSPPLRPDRPEKPARPEQPMGPPGTWVPRKRGG